MPGMIEGCSDHTKLRSEDAIKEKSQSDQKDEGTLPPSLNHLKDHPPEQIIGNIQAGVVTPQQKFIQVIKIYVYTPKYHLLKIKQSKTLKVEVNDKINIKQKCLLLTCLSLLIIISFI